jgi:hypothetical protein
MSESISNEFFSSLHLDFFCNLAQELLASTKGIITLEMVARAVYRVAFQNHQFDSYLYCLRVVNWRAVEINDVQDKPLATIW